MNLLYVGIDDTDSPEGMCTTYITFVIINKLKSFGLNIIDYPKLIRLNPFARFKTRGNGAVSFKIPYNTNEELNKIKKIIIETVSSDAMIEHENTNPGIVFYETTDDQDIDSRLKKFTYNAIYEIITIKEAEKLAKEIGCEFHQIKKGRGIIGSLAAIGSQLTDKTYELLAYRIPENYGTPRKVNADSVIKMNKETYPKTFDNLDEGYMAITPHTPCPVLYGIRGENPEIVKKAHKIVEFNEDIEGYCIYETNQHTDMHIQNAEFIKDLKKNACYKIKATVDETPRNIEGGHYFFNLKDETGIIECAAYEPTKNFRETIRMLRKGDIVTIYGGIGSHDTLNIEKIKIHSLAEDYILSNPICECGHRMKSAGKNKGFKCPSCGLKLRDDTKIKTPIPRELKTGFYEVPPSARRHLSKQIIRMRNNK